MTYTAGSSIQAADFNTFANSAGYMNELIADLHSGATTLPNAGLGYGQTPLATVTALDNVAFTNWNLLYTAIRNVGTHQGTSVVPPLPASGPIATDVISAYNGPPTLSTLIGTLQTNRFVIAPGQTALNTSTNVQPGATPWTNTLTFNYSVDFGSWNNARYFFNSGGKITLGGAYSPIVTVEDTMWNNMLVAMSPLVFDYTSTTPNSGSGGTAIGFYGLTTAYQTIYTKIHGGGGYYSASYMQVQAKLANIAGTNGILNFTILLADEEVGIKEPKNGTTTYTVIEIHSAGAVTYPGTVTVTNLGFIST